MKLSLNSDLTNVNALTTLLSSDLTAIGTLATTIASQNTTLQSANLASVTADITVAKRPAYSSALTNQIASIESLITYLGDNRNLFIHAHQIKDALHKLQQDQHLLLQGITP